MAISHFSKLSKPKRSAVYSVYWKFAAKRFELFTRRLSHPIGPWTNDSILQAHRFTNVFRASDRVSQYLIDLQYQQQDTKELFFKTMLFKVFNKIETWRYLDLETGGISWANFSFEQYDKLLLHRMASGKTIYSAAYIMPSAGGYFGHKLKHSNHLALLEKMMGDELYLKVQESDSLEKLYHLLLSYPSLGSFLAFQYAIDINYSTLTNFSEMDFVVAGPGAKNGIAKCFTSLGDYSFRDVIGMMADDQYKECERLEICCPDLWGRSMQLIDCQNIFCEVDKYLRVAHPELNEASGKSRIKQKFSNSKGGLELFFPPKWNINKNIQYDGRRK